ncbi:MAG: YqzG/YhdC family protein [Alicyclobacillus sp.]|nr:YqzG/YhdC family protein [Alicyclobacillus sp.]
MKGWLAAVALGAAGLGVSGPDLDPSAPPALISTRHIPARPAQGPYTKPEPAYARWGKMAMALVQRRYPQAAIVDYLHVGRRNLSATRAQETFKLWLRQGKQEFGVYVTITFNPKTNQVISTQMRKVAR